MTNNFTTNITINDTIKLTELEQLVLNEIELDLSVTREKMEQSMENHLEHFKELLIA